MRRLLVISGIILAAVLALLVIRNLSGDSNPYLVRAVFDNGAFVVPDVDVRVAGANVGSVDSIDVSMPDEVVTDDPEDPTSPGKAIVVMKINDPDFQDFRDDASCIIRPQSLIGEKF
ncbi:MAG: MlaD family protein, partial [Solirubrobacterales bacterium]